MAIWLRVVDPLACFEYAVNIGSSRNLEVWTPSVDCIATIRAPLGARRNNSCRPNLPCDALYKLPAGWNPCSALSTRTSNCWNPRCVTTELQDGHLAIDGEAAQV